MQGRQGASVVLASIVIQRHPHLFHRDTADRTITRKGSFEGADFSGINRNGHGRFLQLARVVQGRRGNFHLPIRKRTPHTCICLLTILHRAIVLQRSQWIIAANEPHAEGPSLFHTGKKRCCLCDWRNSKSRTRYCYRQRLRAGSRLRHHSRASPV